MDSGYGVLMEDARTNKDQDKFVNSANIALKGIIGVKAMAEIARVLGKESDAAEYGVSCSSPRLMRRLRLVGEMVD